MSQDRANLLRFKGPFHSAYRGISRGVMSGIHKVVQSSYQRVTSWPISVISSIILSGNPRIYFKKAFKLIMLGDFRGLLTKFMSLIDFPGPSTATENRNGFQVIGKDERYNAWANVDPGCLDSRVLNYKVRKYCDVLPKISVVTATYNPPPVYLEKMIQSVNEQQYTNWELCMADDCSSNHRIREIISKHSSRDPRIKVIFNDRNLGISKAFNRAASLATGDYLAFVDHDDELTANALATIGIFLHENPETDILYTDQDKIDTSDHLKEPFFKPTWSPCFFMGVMYVGHLLVVKKNLFEKVSGFNSEFDKVQDYELVLRLSELTDRIRHVPQVLYHWRMIEGSIALGTEQKSGIGQLQVSAVNAHLLRQNIEAIAIQHVNLPHRVVLYPLPKADTSMVSIIIPTKDAPEYIGPCLASIFGRSTYKNIEVILIDDGTSDKEALEIFKNYPVRVLNYEGTFNYSKANNQGVMVAKGEYVILLNNDTQVLSPDWIETLIFHVTLPHVGAVGPLLVYPDDRVQHAGVSLNAVWRADHVMRGFPSDCDGYFGSLACTREVTAVTGACMMTRRSTYLELGGLNEFYGTYYQDVDFCLRIGKSGHSILFVPTAKLIHHESATRGSSADPFDDALLMDIWGDLVDAGDKYW